MIKKRYTFFVFAVLCLLFLNGDKVYASEQKNEDFSIIDVVEYVSVASTIEEVDSSIISNIEVVENENNSLEFKKMDEPKQIKEEVQAKNSLDGVDFVIKDVPKNNGFKCYERYTAITNRHSRQYKLLQVAQTGNFGIKTVNGRYLVALGTYYTKAQGQYFDIIMENGAVIPCMLGDTKADEHTDAMNQKSRNGSVVEFIVDVNAMDFTSKRMGDLSYACNDFKGEIKAIKIYNKNYFD